MLLSVKKVFSLLQPWLVSSSSSVRRVNEQKYERRHSAFTSHIVVKGGTALVCEQPGSQMQHLFHLVFH